MLAVGPAMDGDFPQHEPPPAGSILYSPPPLQTPLCGSSVQNTMLHCSWWSPFSPTPYPAFSSESHQFMSSTSFIASQPCADTSYGPSTTTPSFLPKTGDFPQVTYHDDQRSHSLEDVPVLVLGPDPEHVTSCSMSPPGRGPTVG